MNDTHVQNPPIESSLPSESITPIPTHTSNVQNDKLNTGVKKDFGIISSVESGWKMFWTRPQYFVGITLIPFLLTSGVSTLVTGVLKQMYEETDMTYMMISSVMQLVLGIVSVFLAVGATRGFIESIKNKTPKLSELFESKGLFVQYFLLQIIMGILIIVGLVLFIIPGIILSLMYSLANIALVYEGSSASVALRQSTELTSKVRMKLCGFYFVCGLVNLVGFAMLGVGSLITIPVTTLATVYVYQRLKEQTPTSS